MFNPWISWGPMFMASLLLAMVNWNSGWLDCFYRSNQDFFDRLVWSSRHRGLYWGTLASSHWRVGRDQGLQWRLESSLSDSSVNCKKWGISERMPESEDCDVVRNAPNRRSIAEQWRAMMSIGGQQLTSTTSAISWRRATHKWWLSAPFVVFTPFRPSFSFIWVLALRRLSCLRWSATTRRPIGRTVLSPIAPNSASVPSNCPFRWLESVQSMLSC